jgi:hypothetical protein
MRVRDVRDQLSAQRASHPGGLARNEEQKAADPAANRSGEPLQISSPSRLYPSISTERIMQAVERQRRISQQLEDLRTQQRKRTAFLRTTGWKWIAALCGGCGVLALVFLFLLIVQPGLLARTLDALGGAIALLLVLEESIRRELAFIPVSNWLLSGAALAVVLMMGLWVKLMRPPREA